jgi:broad-specificity NMP kinase
MAARAIVGHRDTDAEHLKKQQDMLEIVYQKRGKGVTTVDTRDKSIRQVAKEIAKIVHLAPYEEAPMQKWLDQIEEGSIKAD